MTICIDTTSGLVTVGAGVSLYEYLSGIGLSHGLALACGKLSNGSASPATSWVEVMDFSPDRMASPATSCSKRRSSTARLGRCRQARRPMPICIGPEGRRRWQLCIATRFTMSAFRLANVLVFRVSWKLSRSHARPHFFNLAVLGAGCSQRDHIHHESGPAGNGMISCVALASRLARL